MAPAEDRDGTSTNSFSELQEHSRMSALDPSPQYVKSNGEIYKVFQKKTKASIEAGDCEHELEDLEGKKAVIAFTGSDHVFYTRLEDAKRN